jgi:preprotein translocase subunit YajC
LIFIFVVFWFVLIRPARKRQKQVQQMLGDLKPGDKVVTSGGVIGTVSALDRDIVQLRIADKVKIDVTKSSVVGLHDQNASPTPNA